MRCPFTIGTLAKWVGVAPASATIAASSSKFSDPLKERKLQGAVLNLANILHKKSQKRMGR